MKSNQYLSADKRRALTVNTVVQLASRRPPSEITTDLIAKEMGVTQGSIFRHFTNKEALFEKVFEWVSKQMIRLIERGMTTGDSPIKKLENVFSAHIQFVSKHPGVPRMIFGELQKSESTLSKQVVEKLLLKYKEYIQTLLTEGKETGELDHTLDVNAGAISFIGMIQGLVMQSMITQETKNMYESSSAVFKIYLHGIGGSR